MTTYGPYHGAFVTAHDGDTFTAVVSTDPYDFGFHVVISPQAQQKFRLNRCNAASLNTPSGDGAHARVTELLSGGPLTILSVGPYKYGDEWMAEVTLADGRNLTDEMILEQWAAPWNGVGSQPLPPWPRTVSP